ncbi:MAG: response regulator transcription factor [Chloroflexaceae bacterium]|nr:response regulator transcription factor [Chloroflexaceae bacterium]
MEYGTEPASYRAHILVVDDEVNIRLTLHALLARSGFTVTTVASGEEALVVLKQHFFDLLLVDLKIPGIDGMQVVAEARKHQPDSAIIVLTGHGSLETALEGLHHGIFDYLLKTTDPVQVVERVKQGLVERQQKMRQRALLDSVNSAVQELLANQDHSAPTASESLFSPTDGHSTTPSTNRSVIVGELHFDIWRQTATFEERPLPLTPTEFRILLCLAEHAGQMLTYTQIVRYAHGYDAREIEASELVKPHIYHLRQKIEPDPTNPRYLLNVRGKGYVLQM